MSFPLPKTIPEKKKKNSSPYSTKTSIYMHFGIHCIDEVGNKNFFNFLIFLAKRRKKVVERVNAL